MDSNKTLLHIRLLTLCPYVLASRKLGIVGKGLLFDTGGYDIKTGGIMAAMKFDCGGAAAILGAARANAALQPPDVEVHFVIAVSPRLSFSVQRINISRDSY